VRSAKPRERQRKGGLLGRPKRGGLRQKNERLLVRLRPRNWL